MPLAGMAGMAGARPSDADKEHATPGYLVDDDNATELTGKLPLVSPPVLE
jgi:hypothetical protein